MTNEEAISLLLQIKHILVNNNSWLENTHEPLNIAFNMAIKALEKQKAISELQPPTDNWETYADRLYDLAYLSGYNDGLVAKGSQDNNV